MAKDWAKDFYNSKQWRTTRNAYYSHKHGLCERCTNAGEIVHHKEYITRDNINDTSITLDWANLELLCRSCHNKEHEGAPTTADGLKFNEEGDMIYE